MRSLVALVVFTGFFSQADNIDFDKFGTGKMPPGWSVAITHPGPPPLWEVVADKTAPSRKNVFEQVSPAGNKDEFRLAVYDKVLCRQGDLSVKFRIKGGHPARTAGLVWGYQDPGNYYLLQFSADQHNLALFHVDNGQLRAIPVLAGKTRTSAVRHDIREDQWFIVRVNYRDQKIRVFFGNRLLFEASDDFPRHEGKTGLWTKAGTVAQFDDFRIDNKD